MNTENTTQTGINKRRLIRIVLFRLTMFIVLMGLMFFLPAGSLKYWQGWVYIGILVIPMLFVFRYLLRNDPELLERRMRHKEKEKEQKLLIKLSNLYFIAAFILPGFDIRYGWSSVPWYIVILADLMVLIGYFIIVLVFKENSYASRIVEVEETQKVITTGPYSVVRHPMYSGVLLMYILSPVALSSYWAVIPAFLLIFIVIARIINEEKVLRKDLEGYEEYQNKVKHRLIPGLW